MQSAKKQAYSQINQTIMKKVYSEIKPIVIVIISISFFLINFSSCNQQSDSKIQMEKITVMQSSVSLGDPHIVIDNMDQLSIVFSVYEALVKQDKKGKYQASIAENWEVGNDNRSWTFNLRKGVRFHNGDILCADDVIASLNRVLDPSLGGAFGTGGVYISYLGEATFKAIDNLTVSIVTKEPMADLLDLLSVMPISPESEIHKLPNEYCGSGPYKISELTPTKTILKEFEGYWRKSPEIGRASCRERV